MKTCPRCGLENAVESRFCTRCGRALDGAAPIAAGREEATVRWAGEAVRVGGMRRALPLSVLFAAKDRVVIGRAPESDLCLPHPTISRRHALLERVPEGLRLTDLGSVNGVFLAGRRLGEPVLLPERERFSIGPFLFTLAEGVLNALDSSQSLRLEARDLEKVVPMGGGQMRKLLDNINLVVEPGEFVSLLGPSGSGKSTLMDCLNGRRRATAGKVLANGEDFYHHFDSFRQSLGYVPQKDIVHTQLTVARALYYTALLRLPTDTEPAELTGRIEEVVQQMELGPHRDTLVANLSGGQIKRVSLGAELLARPCLLYIDEATSGLDAGTEARMMRLFRQLADEGKTVFCITHNVDNVDRCNLVLLLARGKLVYYGPPGEALRYFGVGRISEVYDRLGEKDPAIWEQEFRACSVYQEFVAKRLAAGLAAASMPALPGLEKPNVPSAPAPTPAPAPARSPELGPPSPLLHQFRVLTQRYVELLWGDRRGLRLLLLQAPIVACFILLGFMNKPYQERVLMPRAPTEHERMVLTAYRGLLRQAGGGNLDPAERNVLDRVQVIDEPSGVRLSAREVAELSALLRRTALAEALPGRLGRVRIRVEGSDDSITAAELAEVLRTQQAAMLDKVLSHPGPVLPDRVIINPHYTYMVLFLVAITVLWFGCNNAAKEIVKEEAIYGRERAVNLGIVPYLASKFLVLGALSAFQALVMMVLTFGALELAHIWWGLDLPEPSYRLEYAAQFGVLVLLAMTGVAFGLLLSACVATPDRANALLPYVLIPQIILGGGIMPISSGLLYGIAVLFSPLYWAFRAIRRGATTLPEVLPMHMDYNDGPWLACAALVAQMVVLLLLTAWFLKRKDVRTA
jgi:ABC-type multidrug transport system ATPase subunit